MAGKADFAWSAGLGTARSADGAVADGRSAAGAWRGNAELIADAEIAGLAARLALLRVGSTEGVQRAWPAPIGESGGVASAANHDARLADRVEITVQAFAAFTGEPAAEVAALTQSMTAVTAARVVAGGRIEEPANGRRRAIALLIA